MRLLINTSTLKVGGGVQVAVSVLNELKNIPGNEYVVVVSRQVQQQLPGNSFPANFSFRHLDSPAQLRTRRRIVSELDRIERETQPDAVLTIFGPAYWRPKAPHICGFALGWLITPESPAHKLLNFQEKLKQFLVKMYKWHYFRRDADYLWCETEDVRSRLHRHFGFPIEQISVAGNTHGAQFFPYMRQNAVRKVAADGTFKLLTVSAYYPHKNLEIIKKVIPYLVGKIKFQFVLTISKEDYQRVFDVCEREFVTTLGPLTAAECPAAYAGADALFLPTLLECFSANYPEAMVMRKPILTSNLSFATSLLGDAAAYFDPLDPEDVARSILDLVFEPDLYAQLVDRGETHLNSFPSAADRAKNLMMLCESAVAGSARGKSPSMT